MDDVEGSQQVTADVKLLTCSRLEHKTTNGYCSPHDNGHACWAQNIGGAARAILRTEDKDWLWG